jgi:hypothetical protein
VPLSRRGQDRKVDRILVGFLRRERAGEQHVALRRVLQRDHTGDREFVHRDRTGLVHAEHVHRRGILRGAQAGHQHAVLRQLLGSDRQADREHDGKSDRHRTHQQDEHERNHLEKGRAPGDRHHDHHAQQRADNDEKPADDLGHHRLDVKFRTRPLHELGGAAKVGLRPGQHHDPIAFARRTTDRREDVAGFLSASFDSPVSADWSTLNAPGQDFDIRGNDVARAHADDIAKPVRAAMTCRHRIASDAP